MRGQKRLLRPDGSRAPAAYTEERRVMLTPKQLEKIRRAAADAGVDVAAFIRNAAVREAEAHWLHQ